MVSSPPDSTGVCEATPDHDNKPGTSSRNHPWTDSQTNWLIDLWNDTKLSAAGIAKCMHLTRNAVLGKVWRLGLQPHPKPAARQKPVRKRRPKAWTPPPPPPIVEEPQPAEFMGLTFAELAPQQCHYPRGEHAPFLYCGQPVRENSSYCPYCHRLSYFPRTPARRHAAIQAPWTTIRGRYG